MLDITLVKRRPDFASFDAALINPKLDVLLSNQREKLQAIELVASPNWENTMDPLQAMDDELDCFWSPVRHLNSVMNDDAIRAAYNAGLVKLSEWYTDLGQNRALYECVQKIRNEERFTALKPAQQKVIENVIRDFKLSGVSLNGEQKARYRKSHCDSQS